MCTSTGGLKGLLAKLAEKNPSLKLREQISANDPLSKALGYEGLADPAGDLQRKVLGMGPSKLDRKIERNRDRLTQEHIDAERAPTGGHILSIAAKKARLGRR